MKNRLFAIVLTAVMLVCCAAPMASSAAKIENADGGGFDFYSITVHYDKPTVLQYESISSADSKKDKLIPTYSTSGRVSYDEGYVFAEPEDTFVIRTGDSLGSKGTAYNYYKSGVRSGGGYVANFLALTGNGHTSNVYYTNFPNQYGYIHNIHDNDLIQYMDPISLRGCTEITDDALNLNPNIEFDEEGYAKDINGGRIDYNGYLLDENYNWYTVDANGKVEICQLFRETTAGDIVPVSRYDSEGKIIKVSQYSGAMIYIVDENGEIAKDSQGNLRSGTPVSGTPVMKTKITKITIEIDALGTQLYDEVSSDPQQKNTITVSIGNTKENIETIPEAGTVLGTAKSITTRTEAIFNKKVSTVASVELDGTQELYDSIASGATRLYVQFGVEEIQGEDAYKSRYILDNNANKNIGFKTSEVEVLTAEDISRFVTPSPEPSPTPDTSFFSADNSLYLIIGGAAILVLVIVIIVIIIVVCSKKKKKKAASEETVENTDVPNDDSAEKVDETTDETESTDE